MPLNPKLEKIVQKDYAYLLTLEPQQVRDIINREFTKLESEGTAVGSIVNNTIKTTIRETPIRIYYPKKIGIQPALKGQGRIPSYLSSSNLSGNRFRGTDKLKARIRSRICVNYRMH